VWETLYSALIPGALFVLGLFLAWFITSLKAQHTISALKKEIIVVRQVPSSEAQLFAKRITDGEAGKVIIVSDDEPEDAWAKYADSYVHTGGPFPRVYVPHLGMRDEGPHGLAEYLRWRPVTSTDSNRYVTNVTMAIGDTGLRLVAMKHDGFENLSTAMQKAQHEDNIHCLTDLPKKLQKAIRAMSIDEARAFLFINDLMYNSEAPDKPSPSRRNPRALAL